MTTTTYYTITGNWGDVLRGKGEEKVYDHTNNTVKTVKFDYTNKGEFVNITNLKTVRLHGAGEGIIRLDNSRSRNKM